MSDDNNEQNKRVMNGSYESWIAPGPGSRAQGNMYLIIEGREKDKYEITGYSASSCDAQGRHCTMFDDERRVFDNYMEDIKGTTFYASKEALDELCSLSSYYIKDFVKAMKASSNPMVLEQIDNKLGVFYKEHQGMGKDKELYDANKMFYKIGEKSILPAPYEPSGGYTLDSSEINLEKVRLPEGLETKRMTVRCWSGKFPKQFQNVQFDHVFLKGNEAFPEKISAQSVVLRDMDNIKITDGIRANSLDIEESKNIQVLEGNFTKTKLDQCKNVVISKKAKMGSLSIEQSDNIVIPTSLGNMNNLSINKIHGSNFGRIYLYDKTLDDRVLLDLSTSRINGIVRFTEQDIDYYEEKINKITQKNSDSNNEDLEWAKNSLARVQHEKELLDKYDIHERPDTKGNRSLKEIYTETSKRSGISRADDIAKLKIAQNIISKAMTK